MECPVCLNTWNSERTVPHIVKCGHSLCFTCACQLTKDLTLTCPTCLETLTFTQEKVWNQTYEDYVRSCVSAMPVNHTLLALVASKEPVLSRSRSLSRKTFKLGQKCSEHGLPIHSYSEKPYSLACDTCALELKELGLNVQPFPEVVSNVRAAVSKVRSTLKAKSQQLEEAWNASCLEENIMHSFEEHFQFLRIEMDNSQTSITTKIESILEAKNKETLRESTACADLLDRIQILEDKIIHILNLPDSSLVRNISKIQKILKKTYLDMPEVSVCPQNINFNLSQLENFDLKNWVDSTYSVRFEDPKAKQWQCQDCKTLNTQKHLLCKQCSWPKFQNVIQKVLESPQEVSEEEIEVLNARRKLELEVIGSLDVEEHGNSWYIINADWVNAWKNFVFNKVKKSRNLCQNARVGVLPPGPISNHKLFDNSEEPLKLKPKLKPVAHYLGLNQKVWNMYLSIYGGGPQIVRSKLNIYQV